MRRQRTAGAVVGVIALWMALGGVASGVQVCLRNAPSCLPGYVTVSFGAHVIPTRLPENDYVQVTWAMSGKFGKADDGHPPALREVELDIDKDVRVNPKGYPVCKTGRRLLEKRDPGAALKACGDSILGKGLVHFEIAFPEEEPLLVEGPLTIFNGGRSGTGIRLYLHAFIAVPVPTAVVTTVTIVRRGTGIHSVAKIPVVAGGSGSVVDFRFTLGKTFEYKGKEVGYFEARCPDGVFETSVKKLLFENEARTPGEGASTQLKGSLAVPCTGRR